MINFKRKGFTLVELLIVIVVIGVWSAMMMLSSTEAVSSAKASNIISNMRNLKTAALEYYADNMDKVETKGAKIEITDITPYLTTTKIDGIGTNYELKFEGDGSLPLSQRSWYIMYDTGNLVGDTQRIREKLAGRAKSIGLFQGTDAKKAMETSNPSVYDATTACVFYKVR